MRTELISVPVEELEKRAVMACKTALVPTAYRGKPQDATVAMMYGAEIGLSPLQSLQGVAVINGKPSLHGDALLAVVQASGLLERIHETKSKPQGGTDDDYGATCELYRRGHDRPIVQRFTIADAKRAGLWGRKGPWSDYPQRMLQMRARSWALRDGFADVLAGMQATQELLDYPGHPLEEAAAPVDSLDMVAGDVDRLGLELSPPAAAASEIVEEPPEAPERRLTATGELTAAPADETPQEPAPEPEEPPQAEPTPDEVAKSKNWAGLWLDKIRNANSIEDIDRLGKSIANAIGILPDDLDRLRKYWTDRKGFIMAAQLEDMEHGSE